MADPLVPAPSALPTAADILPKTPDETAPPPGEEVPPSLPDELLEIPAMYGLLHGAPAAVYAEVTSKAPEVEVVVKHQKALEDSGFGFYRSKDDKLTVLYNSVYVSPDQLKEADEAGKLTEVAVPLDQATSQFEGAASGATLASAPGISASGSPPSAGAQKRVTTARLKNLQPGSPTSGPSPGAGRIINNILKKTV